MYHKSQGVDVTRPPENNGSIPNPPHSSPFSSSRYSTIRHVSRKRRDSRSASRHLKWTTLHGSLCTETSSYLMAHSASAHLDFYFSSPWALMTLGKVFLSHSFFFQHQQAIKPRTLDTTGRFCENYSTSGRNTSQRLSRLHSPPLLPSPTPIPKSVALFRTFGLIYGYSSANFTFASAGQTGANS